MPPLSHAHTPADLRVGREIHNAMTARGFPGFEPLSRVAAQQASIIRGRSMRSFMWECFKHCEPEDICRAPRKCTSVCLLGAWRHRADTIVRVYDRLIDDAETAVHATMVPKGWSFELGALHLLKPASLLRRLREQLKDVKGVRGLAYVDVSVNYVKRESFWQGHLHAVLTGSTHAEIKAALAIEPTSAVPKPVMVKKIREGDLMRTLAYATKPLPEGRVAYTADNGRQRQRYVRVPSDLLLEHDEWRAGMRMPERFMIIGMRLGHLAL